MSAKPWPPNWRDISQYPDWGKLTPQQKAWEFLRRNPQYRTAHAQYTAELKENPSAGSDADPPGEWLQVFANAFGTIPPCDPAEPIPEDVELLNWETPPDEQRPNHHLTVYYGKDGAAHREDLIEDHLSQVVQDLSEILEDDGVPKTLVFDLGRPIGPQLERAKGILKCEAKALAINQKLSSHRQRDTHYVLYLRILDAESADIGLKEMAQVLLPDVPNAYGTEFLAEKRLRSNLERAHELRDGHYMILLKK